MKSRPNVGKYTLGPAETLYQWVVNVNRVPLCSLHEKRKIDLPHCYRVLATPPNVPVPWILSSSMGFKAFKTGSDLRLRPYGHLHAA